MPSIRLRRDHGTTLDDAKEKVRAMVDRFVEEEKRIVDTIDWSSDGARAKAKGKGFTATFVVDDQAVDADIDLSFFAAPLKGKIERELSTRLDKAFDG